MVTHFDNVRSSILQGQDYPFGLSEHQAIIPSQAIGLAQPWLLPHIQRTQFSFIQP